MAGNKKIEEIKPDLHLAFDVGHSSIGWAVFKANGLLRHNNPGSSIDLLGCGVVTFRADDCLASKRRDYRRQRRHIRSTRQRIRRMKMLLAHLGVLTEKELDRPGCAWPWQLAARVLSSKSGGNPSVLLTWAELWDVLRWYAHNRGYDGNQRWSGAELDNSEDSEKEANARGLMGEHSTKTMAETFCAVCGIDPLGQKKSCNVDPEKRFKSKNAAFPREIVESEVRQILRAHLGKLKAADEKLERALFEDWRALPCPALELARRYQGGLLFGQLVPRFDNRIISKCPISGEKVPTRDCAEFLNFRWGMMLANIRVGRTMDRELRPLNLEERTAIDKLIRERGFFTAKELKTAVRANTKCERDNLDTMLMHPDAKDALLVDPAKKLETSDKLAPFWTLMPIRLQKRYRGQLRRGKVISLRIMREQLEKSGEPVAAFDAELQRQIDSANTNSKKNKQAASLESLLGDVFTLPKISGRAAYARPILMRAFEEVMSGRHPKEEGGCLFITDKMREAQLNRPISEQTNNHLVRHRLLILERLASDIVKDYAAGEKQRVEKITIEVNRDLRQMSGKTAKEKAQEMGSRIANHHLVAEKLEAALGNKKIGGRPVQITAGLIRKGRLAEDLGWTCPYTGQKFEAIDLVTRRVDKDHVVPRSERSSDALDSLVVTFSTVNKWKGKRTAWQFIEQEQGKPVPDAPNLSIISLSRYKAFVENLDSRKGHDDDKRRKKKRKELMLLPRYEEKEFTPRDLTQTSQLVRLGAQTLRRVFAGGKKQPVIVSLPGSVTGTVRKAWKILGCLSLANPQVLDEAGGIRSKTEIRDITHLHHALDACVLGLASYFIPNNGRIWELILRRNLTDSEKRELESLGVFAFNAENRFEMRDLDSRIKEQIRNRLAEKRVVQHIPARMSGLRVEQNIWRVVSVEGEEATIQQRMRAPDGTLPAPKQATEKIGRLLGLQGNSSVGKLMRLKGALVIPDNFGVALDPEPTIIPFHNVWPRISQLRAANGGKYPRILRNGGLVVIAKGNNKGIWRVISTEATGRVRITFPDTVRRIESPPNYKKVSLSSLLRDGLKPAKSLYTGLACPTTLSA